MVGEKEMDTAFTAQPTLGRVEEPPVPCFAQRNTEGCLAHLAEQSIVPKITLDTLPLTVRSKLKRVQFRADPWEPDSHEVAEQNGYEGLNIVGHHAGIYPDGVKRVFQKQVSKVLERLDDRS